MFFLPIHEPQELQKDPPAKKQAKLAMYEPDNTKWAK